MTPLHPVAAATHPDPYPFYAELVATRPFYRDASLGLWGASSARSVRAVLTSPACLVRPRAEPVPRAFGALASGALFGQWARMNDEPFHGVVRRGLGALIERWRAAPGVDVRARARLSFGWGTHVCPGERLAKSLATGALEVLLATDLARHREAFEDVPFLPLLNARVPLLPALRLAPEEVG